MKEIRKRKINVSGKNDLENCGAFHYIQKTVVVMSKYEFQAEINQLLSLIINAFYSNKDIFIRELLSNASDAIDKMRHISLTDSSKSRSYEMKLKVDKDARLLTIEDNGIGMNKEDLIKCLGTIANSGTKQFMENLKEGTADVSLIGQFGVGFYSSYLVAENVKVYSRKDGDVCYLWESNAGGTFTIDEASDEASVELSGTRIELTMKPECLGYLEERKLMEIVKEHCQYLTHPINLLTTRTETKEEIVDEEDGVEEIDGDDLDKKTSDEEKETETEIKETESLPRTKTVEYTVEEWKQLNEDKPLWLRKADTVTPEEYASFYKSLTNSKEDHLAVKHFSAEGQFEFKALLYVSKTQRQDMFQKSSDGNNNIKLYVKRVFIMDNCDKLVPEWLSCISGIVDSEDLPLNVSREMLQQNNIMKIIKKNIIKKSIELFTELSDDDTDEGVQTYKTFFTNFSKNIKLGIHEDSANREKLIKLLRFYSANTPDKWISLSDYVKDMKADQKNIYFITGQNVKSLKNTPFVKNITSKGYNVLFMTEAIDEYITPHFDKFDGNKLVNITKENADIEGEKMDEDTKKSYESFCKKVKGVVGEQVTNVTVSTLPEDEPCCVTSASYGWSANMERIMKAQTLQANSVSQQATFMSKKNFELNPKHYMINKLYEEHKASSMDDKIFSNVMQLLFQTAMISSGYIHEDPSEYSKRVYTMISTGMFPDESDNADSDNALTENVDAKNAENADSENSVVVEEENMEEVD